MTGPLNNILKVGDLVHIKVDQKMREIYSPDFLHDVIGNIWDIDEEHIWVKVATKNMKGESYMSGPHRYCWIDITIEKL